MSYAVSLNLEISEFVLWVHSDLSNDDVCVYGLLNKQIDQIQRDLLQVLAQFICIQKDNAILDEELQIFAEDAECSFEELYLMTKEKEDHCNKMSKEMVDQRCCIVQLERLVQEAVEVGSKLGEHASRLMRQRHEFAEIEKCLPDSEHLDPWMFLVDNEPSTPLSKDALVEELKDVCGKLFYGMMEVEKRVTSNRFPTRISLSLARRSEASSLGSHECETMDREYLGLLSCVERDLRQAFALLLEVRSPENIATLRAKDRGGVTREATRGSRSMTSEKSNGRESSSAAMHERLEEAKRQVRYHEAKREELRAEFNRFKEIAACKEKEAQGQVKLLHEKLSAYEKTMARDSAQGLQMGQDSSTLRDRMSFVDTLHGLEIEELYCQILILTRNGNQLIDTIADLRTQNFVGKDEKNNRMAKMNEIRREIHEYLCLCRQQEGDLIAEDLQRVMSKSRIKRDGHTSAYSTAEVK
eukprot:760373-Hanusia_phi.AAC.1